MVNLDSMSLSDQAYLRIQEMIVTLQLEPGCIVSANDISGMLGIGRMPVRDAFRRLEADGLVSILPRKGILISAIRTDEIFLQLEVRKVLEELIVRRACRHATQAERGRLLELAEGYELATSTGDRTKAIVVDEELHLLLGSCSKNPFAWQALSPFYARFQRIYYSDYAASEEQVRQNDLAHADLMRAIAAGDEAAALESLARLHGNLEDLVRGHMRVWMPAASRR
jgi:DNA-binding GntR family transcriptional regulator